MSVVPFPNVDSTRVRVSVDGGEQPLWSRSGRELFFIDADDNLVAARFDPDAMSVLGQVVLFPIPDGVNVNTSDELYDVDLDGQRFLFARDLAGTGQADGDAGQLIVVENFFEELRRRVGGK